MNDPGSTGARPRYSATVRSAALLVLAVVAVLCVHFGDAATGNAFIADRSAVGDVYHVSLLYERWAQHLGEGYFPLWMPEFAGGYPAPASWMYGLLAPDLGLFLFLPPAAAWTWTAILHAAWGALGMHLLTRAHGAGSEGAFAAGLLFGLSEFMVGRTMVGHLNLVMAVSWAPWVLWQTLRVVRGGRGAVGGLALCAGVGLLAGHVQVWFYVVPMALVLTLAAWRTEATVGALRRMTRVVALVLCLTAVQWLPTVELLRLASPEAVPDDLFAAGSLSLTGFAARMVPGILGHRGSGDIPYWGPDDFDHEMLAVGGMWVLLLAFLALRRPDTLRIVWISLVTVGFLIATGAHTWLGVVLHDLPPLSFSRVPSRALILPLLGLPLLAGLGLDVWLRSDDQPQKERWVPAVVAAARAAGLAVVGRGIAGAALDTATAALEASDGVVLRALLLSFATLVLVLGCMALTRSEGWRRWIPVGGLLIAAWFGSLPPVETVEPDFYYVNWTAPIPAELRRHRLHLDGGTDLAARGRFPSVERDEMRTVREICHVDTRAFRRLWGSAPARGSAYWLDVALQAERRWEGPAYAPPDGVPTESLLALRTLPAIDGGALFEPLGEQLILDEMQVVDLVRDGDPHLYVPRSGAEGVMRLRRLEGGHVRRLPTPDPLEELYDIESPSNAVAFVSEKLYPGWEATVDGVIEPIRSANGVFRCVAVQPGRHLLRMRYRPRSYFVGVWLSAAALVVTLVSLVRGLRSRDAS